MVPRVLFEVLRIRVHGQSALIVEPPNSPEYGQNAMDVHQKIALTSGRVPKHDETVLPRRPWVLVKIVDETIEQAMSFRNVHAAIRVIARFHIMEQGPCFFSVLSESPFPPCVARPLDGGDATKWLRAKAAHDYSKGVVGEDVR